MNLEIIEGEIWYSYMYDLGKDVANIETIIKKTLNQDYCLVGLSAPTENIYYKEDGEIIVASFSSSEYTIENQYVISNKPKDDFTTSTVHFASLYRLAEIHTFSSKYREDSEYALLVLSPIYIEAKIKNQAVPMVLFPFIKITRTGVLILTFRHSFESIGLAELIDLENLFRKEIVTVGIPENIAKTHFHLAALYHGLDPSSQEYKQRSNAIKARKFAENINLFIGTAEGIKFENIAENYQYSIIKSLFFKKQFKPSDIQKFTRANYWQSRPVIYLQRFSNQIDTATRTLEVNNTAIRMILNRVNEVSEKEISEPYVDLRQFEDYLHVMNEAVSVKAYSKTFINNILESYNEKDAKREILWSNLQTQVVIDYIHQVFMELKIIEGLLLYSPPISQKELIRHMESLYYKRYLYEADIVYAGELEHLIEYAKNKMGYPIIEDNIKKNFELRKIKLEAIRNNRIFWFGTFITLLLGISNVDRLSQIFFTPVFEFLGWDVFLRNPIEWSFAITISLILTIAFVIFKLTRF